MSYLSIPRRFQTYMNDWTNHLLRLLTRGLPLWLSVNIHQFIPKAAFHNLTFSIPPTPSKWKLNLIQPAISSYTPNWNYRNLQTNSLSDRPNLPPKASPLAASMGTSRNSTVNCSFINFFSCFCLVSKCLDFRISRIRCFNLTYVFILGWIE